MIHLAPLDLLILAAYFGAVLLVGYRSARGASRSEVEFLLAGRSLTLPVFVMTLVSTWYGGILGVGEYSYRYGISNWVVQGVPYYVFAGIFAAFLAKRIRASNLVTIPDKLEAAYDRRTALLGAFLTFLLTTPAPYVLMLSVFLQMLFGWSLPVALAVTAVAAVSYLYVGGFRADIATDILEFFLMFAGFGVILPFAANHYGGTGFLQANLPPLHLTWHGGNSLQYIGVWFFIALWTLVDPAFHQRCYAARDGSVAQRGIAVSILFWLVFDFLTAAAGLYARAALPDLTEPMMAYPMLAEAVLPPVAKGLFYVGMLATIMSTLNTLALVSAQSLGRDILLRLRPRDGERSGRAVRLTRAGLVISFGLSVIVALAIPSVVRMWYTIGTIIIPGLLIPLVAGYFTPLAVPPRYAFWGMLVAWLTSLWWLLVGIRAGGGSTPAYPLGLEPLIPGMVVSACSWALGRLSRARRGR